MRILASIAFSVVVAWPAAAANFSDIADMSAAEFNELGMFARAEYVKPIADEAEVSYTHVNACLKTAAAYPQTRTRSVGSLIDECVEYAESRRR